MNSPLYPSQPERNAKPLYPPPQDGWEKMPMGYRWPASRLSPENMRRLTILSNQTRRPITKLLQDAVEMFCEQKLEPMIERLPAPGEGEQLVVADSKISPENGSDSPAQG